MRNLTDEELEKYPVFKEMEKRRLQALAQALSSDEMEREAKGNASSKVT